MSSGMAGPKKSTLVFLYALFHVNVSGFAGAKRGLSYTLFTPKTGLLCSMLTFLGCLVPRKAIRRIQLSQKKVFCSMLGFLW